MKNLLFLQLIEREVNDEASQVIRQVPAQQAISRLPLLAEAVVEVGVGEEAQVKYPVLARTDEELVVALTP